MNNQTKLYFKKEVKIDELGRVLIGNNKILQEINGAALQAISDLKNYVDIFCKGKDFVCPHVNASGCVDLNCKWPNPSCDNQCVDFQC